MSNYLIHTIIDTNIIYIDNEKLFIYYLYRFDIIILNKILFYLFFIYYYEYYVDNEKNSKYWIL